MAVTDKNCIHAEVCQYAGTAFESCEKCKFRKHNTINADKQTIDVNEFMEALEDDGFDVCEHYELSETIRGYSYDRIKAVIESCQEHTEETVGVYIEHEWAEEPTPTS